MRRKLKKEAAKVAPTNENPTAVLAGYASVVDGIAALRAMQKQAEGSINAARASLDPVVQVHRVRLEESGVFSKTILVPGTNVMAAYTFKDAYKAVAPGTALLLKHKLGNNYDKLFVGRRSVSVRAGMADRLLRLAKKHNFLDLLEISESTGPVLDFRQKRYDLREKLSSEMNAALDNQIVEFAAAPALTIK